MDLKQILTDIARAIVDTPDAVNVSEMETESGLVLTLTVAEGDVVGNVTVTLSGKPIATVDLYNEKTVSADYEKSFFEKLLSWIRKG